MIAVDQLHFGGTDYPVDRKYINRIDRMAHVIAFIEALELKQSKLPHFRRLIRRRADYYRSSRSFSRLVLLTASALSPGETSAMKLGCKLADRVHYSLPMPTEDEYIADWRKNCRAYGKIWKMRGERLIGQPPARGQYEMFENAPEEETDPRLYTAATETHLPVS
ncbi:hypothetical protein [Mesorhizobium sp. WSM3866]|uniref:hypothetical protein n=1 Tax=Mesorhizobium sp. WSM3866 TaxID=422271 RepID=UPI001140F60C|nr:hypothetical protein [Mesorhizobium sp. WSM3866]